MKHVRNKITEDALNIRTIRELYQDVFLAVYEVIRKHLVTLLAGCPKHTLKYSTNRKNWKILTFLHGTFTTSTRDSFNVFHVDFPLEGNER